MSAALEDRLGAIQSDLDQCLDREQESIVGGQIFEGLPSEQVIDLDHRGDGVRAKVAGLADR